MSRKLRIGIICGGKSAEHEVSLQSARNVVRALDKQRFDLILIGIDRGGRWHLLDHSKFLGIEGHNALAQASISQAVASLPHQSGDLEVQLLSAGTPATAKQVDVFFPVLHGPLGEDGTIQGFLQLSGVPYVGAGVLGSAVGMDKDVMKRLLRDAQIPVAKFLTFGTAAAVQFETVKKELGLPCFVKPANLGSSVGISRADDSGSLDRAVKLAFEYDRKIIIEEFVQAREIECAVLGNREPMASVPGEIIPDAKHGYYSYDAKYLDPDGAGLKVPADLSPSLTAAVKELAVRAYQTLCCEGLGRVDMFLKDDGSLLVNEINTLPGFTNISMYPKLWEASGISQTELISRLIDLALERAAEESRLKSSA